MPDLIRSAARWQPEREFLRLGERALTYGELDRQTNRLARALVAAGVRPGDRVAIYLPSGLDLALAYFGIQKARAIAVPVNYLYTRRELEQLLQLTGARVLLAAAAACAELAGLGQTPVEQLWVLGDGDLPAGARRLAALAAAQPDTPLGGDDPQPDDVAVIFGTSGTTGLAKGVMQTHANIILEARTLACHLQYRLGREVMVSALPLFNNFGATVMLVGTLNTVGRLVLLEKWDTEAVLQAISVHGGTRLAGTPTMFVYLIEGLDRARHRTGTLRACFSAGQRLPPEVRRSFEREFGVPLVEIYGSTEAQAITATPLYGTFPEGSAGHPVGSSLVRIVDDQGQPLPPGEIGEIVVDSDKVARGYWNDPHRSEADFAGGWHSGDMGYQDEHSYLYVVDRKKDMIITGGHNIFPAEIEAMLYEHPDVALCCVVGLPDAVKGEIPVAYVVLRQGAAVAAAELQQYCRQGLAAYKVPRRVVLTDALPLSATGKILRREVREMAVAGGDA